MFSGEAFALQKGHIKASAGEEGGGGAAAGASAYYYDVCVFGRSDVRVSVFYLRLEPCRKSLSQGIGGRQILASHSPPLDSRLRRPLHSFAPLRIDGVNGWERSPNRS